MSFACPRGFRLGPLLARWRVPRHLNFSCLEHRNATFCHPCRSWLGSASCNSSPPSSPPPSRNNQAVWRSQPTQKGFDGGRTVCVCERHDHSRNSLMPCLHNVSTPLSPDELSVKREQPRAGPRRPQTKATKRPTPQTQSCCVCHSQNAATPHFSIMCGSIFVRQPRTLLMHREAMTKAAPLRGPAPTIEPALSQNVRRLSHWPAQNYDALPTDGQTLVAASCNAPHAAGSSTSRFRTVGVTEQLLLQTCMHVSNARWPAHHIHTVEVCEQTNSPLPTSRRALRVACRARQKRRDMRGFPCPPSSLVVWRIQSHCPTKLWTTGHGKFEQVATTDHLPPG